MSCISAVDTNVFVYALDDTDVAKQAKAQALLAQRFRWPTETALLWQVAGEFLSCLHKWESLGRIKSDDLAAHFRDVFALFPLMIPTAHVFETSRVLVDRFSLSHWDSMLLAACKEAGVTTLFSEDMDSGMNYDGVDIVNPFN